MKVSEIITKAREILRDSSSPHHYADSIVIGGVLSGLRHLISQRPEARYINGILADIIPSSIASSTDICVDQKWEDGLAFYAASRCYDSDTTDSVNLQLAQQCLNRAIQEFQK